MSVDMQFFLFNAETSVATGKSADPNALSTQNSSGFAALFDDELTAQVAEGSVSALSGQEVAAEDSSVVDVSALLRGKLRAAETGQTPDLLPVKPDVGQSADIMTENLGQQSQLHSDAPLLASQATSTLLVDTSAAAQLPVVTDSPWLQLISAAEQYAVNLGVNEQKTLTSPPLNPALDTESTSPFMAEPQSTEQPSVSVPDAFLTIMNESSDSSDSLGTAMTKTGEVVSLTSSVKMLEGSVDTARSMDSAQPIKTEALQRTALQTVTAAEAPIDALDGAAVFTTEAVVAKTATTAKSPLDESLNVSLATAEGSMPVLKTDAILVNAELSQSNPIAPAVTLTPQPAESNASGTQANATIEMIPAQQQTEAIAQTSTEKLPAEALSAPDTVQPHRAADVAAKQQESVLQSTKQQQTMLQDTALPDASVIERQANVPSSQQAMTQVSQLSFADHQKAANAAETLIQKQQLKAELATGAEPQQGQNQQQSSRQESFSAALQATMPDAASPNVGGQNFDKLSAASSLATSAGAQLSSQSVSTQHSAATSHAAAVKAAEAQLSPLYLQEPQAATQLKDRVMYQVQQKIQTAEIRLAPEDLGSVQIKVNLQQDQLSVQFLVQQPQAKEALEQQMPRLKELLQQQGVELTDSQVSQQQQQQKGEKQSRSAQQGRISAELNDEILPQQAIVRSSDRAVDYYA